MKTRNCAHCGVKLNDENRSEYESHLCSNCMNEHYGYCDKCGWLFEYHNEMADYPEIASPVVCEKCIKKYSTEGCYYEVCDKNCVPFYDDKFLTLDTAKEFAIKNNGYTINQVWLPLDENKELDFGANILYACLVWEKD